MEYKKISYDDIYSYLAHNRVINKNDVIDSVKKILGNENLIMADYLPKGEDMQMFSDYSETFDILTEDIVLSTSKGWLTKFTFFYLNELAPFIKLSHLSEKHNFSCFIFVEDDWQFIEKFHSYSNEMPKLMKRKKELGMDTETFYHYNRGNRIGKNFGV